MSDHDDNRAEWRKHAPNDPYSGGCAVLIVIATGVLTAIAMLGNLATHAS